MTSIRRRTWTAPSGNDRTAWLVDYRDQAGRRRSKQFTRKKDAEAWRVGAEHEVATGIHTPDSASITVAEAAAIWIKSKEDYRDDDGQPLEPTTIAAYEQHARLHIAPLCGGARLSQLTTKAIGDYRRQLSKRLSGPMALRVAKSLSGILAEAQAQGYVAQNVAAGIKSKRRGKSRHATKPVILSHDELRAVLTAAQDAQLPYAYPLACLAVFTGLRASELRGLPWSAVDLQDATLRVEQRADARGG